MMDKLCFFWGGAYDLQALHVAVNNPHDSNMPDIANQNMDRFTLAISLKNTSNTYIIAYLLEIQLEFNRHGVRH